MRLKPLLTLSLFSLLPLLFVGCGGDNPVTTGASSASAKAKAVAAGFSHTCAITTSGAVKCWGANGSGQLGNQMTFASSNIPIDVVGLSSEVLAIAADGWYTCALTSSGGVKCWGDNSNGELGVGVSAGPETCGDRPCSTTPVAVLGFDSAARLSFSLP